MHPFLERIKGNAYDNLSVEGYQPDVHGWVQDGFDTCLNIVSEKFKNNSDMVVFEVGSWKGASAVKIAEKFKGKLDALVCIDTWLGAPEFYTQFLDEPGRMMTNNLNGWPQIFYIFTKNMKTCGYSDVVVPFPISSVQGADVMRYYGIKADVIYIDAAHEYDAVLADLEAYRDLVKEGGILWGDDYGHTLFPGLSKAVDFFAAKYGYAVQVYGINWIIV